MFYIAESQAADRAIACTACKPKTSRENNVKRRQLLNERTPGSDAPQERNKHETYSAKATGAR